MPTERESGRRDRERQFLPAPPGRSILTTLTVLAGATGAFLGFAWPHYRAASAISAEIAHLEQRIATSDEQHVSLDALATRLAAAKAEYESTLREIPPAPDRAGLMRVLAVEPDRESVFVQTITFAKSAPEPNVEDGSINILPLTVDMTARFDPLFDLVARAEQMDQLVRVASILIERSKGPAQAAGRDNSSRLSEADAEDLLQGTIRLEAVYEGAATEEVR